MSEEYYISKKKQDFFWDKGFWPDLYRELMVHDELRIVVSFEYAARHALSHLEKVIPNKRSIFGRWKLIFLSKPSKAARKQLVEYLKEFQI
jgi:hypothetical protein